MRPIYQSQIPPRAILLCALIALSVSSLTTGDDRPKTIETGSGAIDKMKSPNRSTDVTSSLMGPEQKLPTVRLQLKNLKTIFVGCMLVGILAILALSISLFRLSQSTRLRLEKAREEAKQQEQVKNSLEQQLIHRQKQKTIAALVGGIVHEFNNTLTAVVAQSELGKYYDDRDAKNAAFQRVIDATLQSAELASQLLTYAVADPVTFGKVNLNRVVDSAKLLVSVNTRDRANINLELADHDVSVYANEVQLQQAIVNLIHLSVTSQTSFQDIKIATGRQRLEAGDLQKAVLGEQRAPGSYCFIRVTHDGAEMDEDSLRQEFSRVSASETLEHESDLVTFLALVRSCQGAMDVTTLPHTGTSITLFFPVFEFGGDIDSNVGRQNESPQAASVLFVDDELLIRESAKITLEATEFNVTTASSSDLALQNDNGDLKRFDCVVIDFQMPKHNGVWLATRLKQTDPKTPLILSSGFPKSSVFDANLFIDFLAKPYAPRELVEVIRRAIGGSDAQHD